VLFSGETFELMALIYSELFQILSAIYLDPEFLILESVEIRPQTIPLLSTKAREVGRLQQPANLTSMRISVDRARREASSSWLPPHGLYNPVLTPIAENDLSRHFFATDGCFPIFKERLQPDHILIHGLFWICAE
jgi:hypothetical protein